MTVISSFFSSHQLFLVLQRCINTVRKEPTALVTVLRIIEREERLDAHWKDKNDKTGFMPQGRLKRWREKALKVGIKCETVLLVLLKKMQ